MPTIAPRESFNQKLHHLLDEILLLGSMVEQAVLDSVDALKRRDQEKAHIIYDNDRIVNKKRYALENDCLTLIATQQPMARDLRFIAAILEINTELERIGDYAKGIARIVLLLGDEPISIPINDLQRMAELSLDMLHRALGAFVARDAETAREIPGEDSRVDELYNHIYNEAILQMIADPTCIERVNHVIWAAHNLERLADRVTNICERIVFVVTGEMKELDVANFERKS